MQRITDLLLLILFLPFIAILFVMIYLTLKLQGSGSVFYRQVLVGRNGQAIHTYQFRTRRSQAEHLIDEFLERYPNLQSNPLKHQPTYTLFGKFLAQTGLCNLPQVIHILTGKMTWVGVKPIYREQSLIQKEWFELYQKYRPGITGIWQIALSKNILRGYDFRFDKLYLKHCSLTYNLKILSRIVMNIFVMRRKLMA